MFEVALEESAVGDEEFGSAFDVPASAAGEWRLAVGGCSDGGAFDGALQAARASAQTTHATSSPRGLAHRLGELKLNEVMVFDPVYFLFLVPGLLLSLWASYNTKRTFNKYARVGSRKGWTGAEAARELIRRRGVAGVQVEETPGFLSDHYDPGAKMLRLSPDVYHGRSLAALGVAAHEAGHAIQHATSYGPLKFRSWVVKPAMIGSNLGMLIASVGLGLSSTGLVWVGVVLFSAFVLFTLVTLPVEFDASNRAVAALQDTGMIYPDEAPGAQAVLRAAAMTYVAAAISAILQLLYFLFRAGLLGGRSDD